MDKYEEALERARRKIKYDNDHVLYEDDIFDIFPELKRSEDERVRKELVEHLSRFKTTVISDIKKHQYDSWIAWVEKQGEQKLVDKVETKFKVGDWVIGRATENEPRQIAEVTENGYKTTYGGWIGFSFEEDMYLWTIQDAKDGDVLQLGKVTAIFKKLIGFGNCKCYCSVWEGEFETPNQDGDDNSYGCHDATPATKEQRDTLMKAMSDAGYAFDFEKKELKKKLIDYPDSLPKDNWELVHEFVEKFGRIPEDEDELNALVEYVLKRQKTESLKPHNNVIQ